MGKIADAIEEVEDELARLEGKYADLEEAHRKLEEELERALTANEELTSILREYSAMEDYLEEYHPGIITAFEVAQRMEK